MHFLCHQAGRAICPHKKEKKNLHSVGCGEKNFKHGISNRPAFCHELFYDSRQVAYHVCAGIVIPNQVPYIQFRPVGAPPAVSNDESSTVHSFFL